MAYVVAFFRKGPSCKVGCKAAGSGSETAGLKAAGKKGARCKLSGREDSSYKAASCEVVGCSLQFGRLRAAKSQRQVWAAHRSKIVSCCALKYEIRTPVVLRVYRCSEYCDFCISKFQKRRSVACTGRIEGRRRLPPLFAFPLTDPRVSSSSGTEMSHTPRCRRCNKLSADPSGPWLSEVSMAALSDRKAPVQSLFVLRRWGGGDLICDGPLQRGRRHEFPTASLRSTIIPKLHGGRAIEACFRSLLKCT